MAVPGTITKLRPRDVSILINSHKNGPKWFVAHNPYWRSPMSYKSYFANFRKNLTAEGIWGRSAWKLEEELKDHYDAKFTALRAEGHDTVAAEQLALRALGE